MFVKYADNKRPDICIVLTAEEGDELYAMIADGRNYAMDCMNGVDTFNNFLEKLEPFLEH